MIMPKNRAERHGLLVRTKLAKKALIGGEVVVVSAIE